MIQTPWAILLCKFSDVATEPFPRQFYEELFTTAGSGKWNMVDFFRDVSHSKLDLSGNQVFGWYTLNKKRSEYTGSGANQAGRNELVAWARQAAVDNRVDLSQYYGVVVCTNVPTDLWGGSTHGRFGGDAVVVCGNGADPSNGVTGMSPSLLGQEMGHGYGLDHSRADGSIQDYQDQWDIMSTQNAFMTPHPVFTQRDVRGRPMIRMGPFLNAWNMVSRGWLNESRIWDCGEQDCDTIVHLRPLSRYDLPGYLAARVGSILVEFRVKEGWDAAIPEPVVLLHDGVLSDNHSYILAGNEGRQGLRAGDTFGRGRPASPFDLEGWMQIRVEDIDAAHYAAAVHISVAHDRRPEAGPGILFGGASRGGEGWMFVNGKIVRIPPRSPLLAILDQVAAIQASEYITIPRARDIIRQEAFTAIQDQVAAQLQQMQAYRVPGPAPLLDQQEQPSIERATEESSE